MPPGKSLIIRLRFTIAVSCAAESAAICAVSKLAAFASASWQAAAKSPVLQNLHGNLTHILHSTFYIPHSMLTDPLSNFLTRVRNASSARKRSLTVRSSRMIKTIAEILMKKRFIENVEEAAKDGQISELTLTLLPNREALQLKRVSKPGQRIYVGFEDIKRVRSGLGICLISTSQGILTGEEARAKKIGGEYLCDIY